MSEATKEALTEPRWRQLIAWFVGFPSPSRRLAGLPQKTLRDIIGFGH